MNVERMLALADAIENAALPVGFSMAWYCSDPGWRTGQEPECGTVCCIAGWAVALFDRSKDAVVVDTFTRAQNLLGLNRYRAIKLFTPPRCDLNTVTREQAVANIRRMVAEEQARTAEPERELVEA